jgi:hypothetical protein
MDIKLCVDGYTVTFENIPYHRWLFIQGLLLKEHSNGKNAR